MKDSGINNDLLYGIFQSNEKSNGTNHKFCKESIDKWVYISFFLPSYIQIFHSKHDLSELPGSRDKNIPEEEYAEEQQWITLTVPLNESGEFAFPHVLGRIEKLDRSNYQLKIINREGPEELFFFINFSGNYELECKFLNHFTSAQYISVRNIPGFGYSSIENSMVFRWMERKGFIEQLGDNHLDYDIYSITNEGKEYLRSLEYEKNGR